MKPVFDWKSFLSQADERIRRGEGRQVADDLKKISVSALPRPSWVVFANLGRRVGVPLFSLRLLQPMVRQKKNRLTPATPEELTVYASVLARVGVAQEAQDILEKVKGPQNPEAFLYLAHLNIYQWDYQSAAVLLKKYIRLSRVEGYKKFIAEMNLLSAFVAEGNYLEAEPLFLKLEEQLKSQSHHLLLGNAYELAAQVELARENFDRARYYLQQSKNLLTTSQGVYLLYAEKWSCLVDLMEKKSRGALLPSDLAGLQKIKEKALQSKDWETIRDCDLYGALLAEDSQRLNAVMLGTPYRSYRQRALRLFQKRVGFSKSTVFGESENSLLFDLQLGFCPTRPEISLVSEPKLLACLRTLASDFYRPISMGQLYSAVYPGEYFDPYSSPQRVRNLIQRLREWAETHAIPLQIHVEDHEMKLEVGARLGFLVHMNYQEAAQTPAPMLSQIKKYLGAEPFFIRDLALLLRISERQAKRWIEGGLQSGHLRIFLLKGRRAYRFI